MEKYTEDQELKESMSFLAPFASYVASFITLCSGNSKSTGEFLVNWVKFAGGSASAWSGVYKHREVKLVGENVVEAARFGENIKAKPALFR